MTRDELKARGALLRDERRVNELCVKTITPFTTRVRRPLIWRVERVTKASAVAVREVVVGNDDDFSPRRWAA